MYIMAQLAFKIRLKHRLSNFPELAKKFEMATQAGLKAAADFVQETIQDVYNLETRPGEHPLTQAMRTSEGYKKLDIPSLIQTLPDEENDLRVGFFSQSKSTMQIIYLQEFGGYLKVTDRMRAWYNVMAYRSKGWKPWGPWMPITFPVAFNPLKESTRYFDIPAKLFLRKAFKKLGNENILVNRVRFAVERAIERGDIDIFIR